MSGSHPGPIESESQGAGAWASMVLKAHPPGDFCCRAKTENTALDSDSQSVVLRPVASTALKGRVCRSG